VLTATPRRGRRGFQPGHTTIATVTRFSRNAKIGDAAASYAAQVSCPTTCAFFDGGGCYAESGGLGTAVTAPLNDAASRLGADEVDVARAEAAAIDRLAGGRPLRMHTVGDCKTDETARIVSAAAERYLDRGGAAVWTYTHAWRTVDRESWGRVSVLASCETPADVALARVRGYAPSIVVDEFADRRRYEIDGEAVLPCPAQTSHATCTSCRLCFNDGALLERGYAIAFAVHGTALAVKKARLSLADPTDESRKLTSRDHVLAFFAEHGEWPTSRQLMDRADVTRASAIEMLARIKSEPPPFAVAA
jgi:hypothetical protein